MSNTTRYIRKIVPTTLGNTFAIVYFLIGLAVAILLGISGLKNFGYCFGFTFGYTVGGYVTGIVGAFAYNLAAKYTGGIKVEVSE
jgi:hypothetical protein